jgi:BON domain
MPTDEQTANAVTGEDNDDQRAWATDQNDDRATARDDPTDQALFRDREATRLVDPVAGEVPDASTDTAADVGTTFPRGVIEGPWEPFESDRPYFAPTDPVVKPNPTGEQGLDVLGGFEPTAMDDTGLVQQSTTGPMPGDDEVKAAVVRELREDAMTTDLELRVEVRDGDVTLGGVVSSLDESEAALEVASRVEGVGNVEDAIEVTGLTDR